MAGARIVRSGNSTALIWAGVLIGIFAVFTVLYALMTLVQGHVPAGLIVLALGVLIAGVGAGLALVGLRACARLTPHGVSWPVGLTGRITIPWADVAQVLVPGPGDRGSWVALQLRDARIVPITPLRRTQAAGATALSPWYLRAGAAVQVAHQHWQRDSNRAV